MIRGQILRQKVKRSSKKLSRNNRQLFPQSMNRSQDLQMVNWNGNSEKKSIGRDGQNSILRHRREM